MLRNILKNKKERKTHSYRIDYNILINGESYAKSVEMPGYDEVDARKRWENHRDSTFTEAQYIIQSVTKIV